MSAVHEKHEGVEKEYGLQPGMTVVYRRRHPRHPHAGRTGEAVGFTSAGMVVFDQHDGRGLFQAWPQHLGVRDAD